MLSKSFQWKLYFLKSRRFTIAEYREYPQGPNNMFPMVKDNFFSKKKARDPLESRSLRMNTISSASKEKLKGTALNQHFMCRGFGDSVGDSMGVTAGPTGYAPLSLIVKKKYARYFSEDNLRAGSTCLLCGSHIINEEWGRHTGYSMHRFSMSIFLTVFENWRFRQAQEVIDAWMYAALVRGNPNTIKPLISTNIDVMKRRLWMLLPFLRDHGVLKESLNFAKGRTFLFDQAEWLGDVSIPPLLFDAFTRVFDFEAKDSMWRIIFDEVGVLFGNPHLEATFDFLELHRVIVGGDKVTQSKTKSDFVEALAGELKLFLIGGELDFSTTKPPYPVVENQYSLYQIANHCLHVLVVLILMTFLGPTVNRLVDVISRINKAERLPVREIPIAAHIAHTIPNITPSKRLLHRKSCDALALRQNTFKVSSEKRSRRPAASGIQNIHLQHHTPHEFIIEETPAVLPIVFEDSKLYDTD